MKRMACSMTIDAVRARTKTVTRRHVGTWRDLKVGDHLTLIEKGRGLKKGEKQVALAQVVVVNVRVERLGFVAFPNELAAEGFPDMSAEEFAIMWLRSHGHGLWVSHDSQGRYLLPGWQNVHCRRIEWEHL